MYLRFSRHFLTFLQIQSILNTPPRALADNPGGSIQGTLGTSRRDSVANLANPQNFPDSLTENTSKTFLDSL